MDPGPVRERCTGNDDRAEELRTQGRKHHHRPARLAIADDAGLGVRLGMKRNHLFEEDGLGPRDILYGLARYGFRQETDEIAGVTGFQRHPDFAFGLEAANAGAMAGAGIDHHERASGLVDRQSFWGHDTGQRVIDRLFQRPAIDDDFRRVAQDMRGRLGGMGLILVSALAHDIPEQRRTLRRIDCIIEHQAQRAELTGKTRIQLA